MEAEMEGHKPRDGQRPRGYKRQEGPTLEPWEGA